MDAYSGDYSSCGTPVCTAPEGLTAGPFCVANPLGSPGAECGAFGLLPVGKDEPTTSTTSWVATENAAIALVKSGTGGCGGGAQAYNLYLNVKVGDTLSSPSTQAISHVTYCTCAE